MEGSPPVPRAILVVYAHPDDESFGPAGALAKYARLGSRVDGVFFTPGQHGETTLHPSPAPAELARLRRQDLRDAAAEIGFAGLDVLDFEDGTLDQAPPTALEDIALDAIRRYRPEVVITFGPGGITRHPDHVAVHRAARAAFDRARAQDRGVAELYYDAVSPERAREMGIADLPDGQPNTRIDTAAQAPIQIAALRCHARHVQDARDMVERLERHPRAFTLLYRAWPPVASGAKLQRFLEG